MIAEYPISRVPHFSRALCARSGDFAGRENACRELAEGGFSSAKREKKEFFLKN